MNGNLFQPTTLVKTSYLQKMFRQVPQENAVIEVNNLLATKPIKQLSRKDIEEIENRYQLSLIRAFKLNLEEFYTVYLNYCLADKVLNKEELDELNHLKQILDLDDKTIDKMHTKLGEVIYKQSFQEAVADGRLSPQEQAFLSQLENTLRLPKALADKISAETRTNFVESYVSRIVADQRLSPAEEQELAAISNSLNVTLEFNNKTKEQLSKLKLYWALENLDLPVIPTDLTLQRAETCHLEIPAVKWHELRKVRHSTGSSYSTRVKVAKGFYLGSGSSSSRSYSVDTLTHIDTGTLYLTNKRIIFTGTTKNSTIPLGKIVDFIPDHEGVEISKETGKSPVLQMKKQADVFCIMLERLLNDR